MSESNQWKKAVIIGGAVCFVALCILLFRYASTMSEEREGFLGIAWAANIRDLKDMQLMAEEGDHRYYVRAHGGPQFEGITVDKIVYGFYKGRFYNVMVYFTSKPSFSKMKDRLSEKYGNPYKPDDSNQKFFWTADTVHLLLTYDEAANQGRVTYFYQPIESEIEQKDKANSGAASPGGP